MMLRKITTIALVALLAALALATVGCRRVRIAESTETKSESKSVPHRAVTKIEAVIDMGVGDLNLSGEATSTDALDARFTYSPPLGAPEVSYSTDAGVGYLKVRQTAVRGTPAFRDNVNTWDLKLAGGIPMDLRLTLGVGRSDIDLTALEVRDLRVLTGVGDTTIDLSSPRTYDVDARIEAGVGNVTVRLPKDMGVRIRGREAGLGNMSADGFIAQGNDWVNSAYTGGSPTVDVDFVRGVGNATFLLVD